MTDPFDDDGVVSEAMPDEPSHRLTVFLSHCCQQALESGMPIDALMNALTSVAVNVAFHNDVPHAHVSARLEQLAKLMPKIYADMRLINMPAEGSA